MDAIWSLQSEVMKILASPRRLEILHLLAEGPHEVGRLAEEMGISQPNVSQHLAVMRAAGSSRPSATGREVRYRLTDPEVIGACDLMRGVLMRRLARLGELSERPDAADERPPIAGRARPPAPAEGMTWMDEPLNLVLFSGTDDKLQAAAVMTAGRPRSGGRSTSSSSTGPWRPSARTGSGRASASSPEAGEAGRHSSPRRPSPGRQPWHETLRQAKELGEVDIQACSLSMDVLRIEEEDLDPLVDGVEGVTAFYLNAGDGHIVFI